MEKKVVTVLSFLKPKAKELGFTKEELEAIAVSISSHLTDEEPSTEVINAEIDAVMPFLKVSQTAVNRIVNARKQEPNGEPTPDPEGSNQGNPNNPQQQEGNLSQIFSDALSKALKPITDDIALLKSEKRNQSYSAKLKEDLKDVDEDFYSILLENKSFESDDDYNGFVAKVKTGWEKISNKIESSGLNFTPPGKGTKSGDDVQDFVGKIASGTQKIVEQRK